MRGVVKIWFLFAIVFGGIANGRGAEKLCPQQKDVSIDQVRNILSSANTTSQIGVVSFNNSETARPDNINTGFLAATLPYIASVIQAVKVPGQVYYRLCGFSIYLLLIFPFHSFW